MDEETALRTAAERFRATGDAHEQARADLHGAVLAALNAGVRVTDVERLSGYKREHIRRLRLAAETQESVR